MSPGPTPRPPLLPAVALAATMLSLALGGCLAPAPGAAGIEPTAAGTAADPLRLSGAALRVVRTLYDWGLTVVEDGRTGFTYPAQLVGSLHYPAPPAGEGAGAGTGERGGEGEAGAPFPLVLFLHGRHGTCATLGRESLGLPGDAVCRRAPALAEPVDSYAGYDYLAEDLARRGYVVVSISGNDVNDRDLAGDAGALARAQLVVRTLDRVASLATVGGDPVGDDLVGRVDLQRIGLMGHSRGGEGVVAAVHHNRVRTDGPHHAIQAVLALAPIDATRSTAPGVAFATLLPYCDGDVYPLHGARIYDRTRLGWEEVPAPQTQLLVLGANHNFYNTVWTSDDARFRSAVADDPFCGAEDGANGLGAGRLTSEEQRANGLAYLNGFFRLHLGGEAALAGLLDGSAPVPAAACRADASWAQCQGSVLVSHLPAAPHRRVVEAAQGREATWRNDLGGASGAEASDPRALEVAWCPADACPLQPTTAAASQLRFAWEGPAAWRTTLPQGAGQLRGFAALTMRVAVDFTDARNPEGEAQDLRIALRDAHGREAAVLASDHGGAAALAPPPGDPAIRRAVLNGLRVPLEAFAAQGLDLARVAEVVLRFDATPAGALQVADLAFVRDGGSGG